MASQGPVMVLDDCHAKCKVAQLDPDMALDGNHGNNVSQHTHTHTHTHWQLSLQPEPQLTGMLIVIVAKTPKWESLKLARRPKPIRGDSNRSTQTAPKANQRYPKMDHWARR